MSQDQRQDHDRLPNRRWILAWVVGFGSYVAVVIVLDERLGTVEAHPAAASNGL